MNLSTPTAPKPRPPRPVKPKPCRICRVPFIRTRAIQPACGFECQVAYAALVLEKQARRDAKVARQAALEDRKQTRQALQKLEPLSYWEKKAEREVNRYVRLRDAGLGCVSCPLPASWDGTWHASHFRSVGAASSLRYHLWNIHKACEPCNKWKSGNLSEYEPGLRERIGDAKVDWLRTQNQIVRRPRDYLERLTRVMRKKANRQAARLETSSSTA